MVDRNAELRATIRRLESNAKRKIRRNERKGLGNVSAFSPIRPSMEVGSLNKRQLTVYQHQLERFQSRKNQFIADANSNALPTRAWREYARKERRYAEKVNAIYSAASGLIHPDGQTVDQAMRIATPDHPSMANQPVNSLFRPPHHEAYQINGLHGLGVLNRKLDRKLSDEYFDETREDNRRVAREMLSFIGDEDLIERVENLTDKQFDTLWNYSYFVADIGMNYESAKQALTDSDKTKNAGMEALDARHMAEAYDWVDWAERVVPE